MTEQEITGIITKGIGGFYYVDAADELFECKARGIFRKQGITPFAGDRVKISVPSTGYAFIESIFDRKNLIKRPPVANIDILLIVASMQDPFPNTLLIDKMTAAAVHKGIVPAIIFTKTDLSPCKKLREIYDKVNIRTFEYSDVYKTPIDSLRQFLSGKIAAFTGNTGAGKSTIINAVFPVLDLKTGEISRKLGRGRHTTRTVELFKTDLGYIADTPGFSTMELEKYEILKKENLASCFGEFADYVDVCKFSSCLHTCEKGCAVIEAVSNGEIPESRHESYKMMFSEIKDLKEWEYK